MDAEMKFAWIPPGHFLMGGNGVSDNPQHRVTISKGFWMGIVPVTQAQWQAAMGYNPSQFRGDERPVENVSWDDCKEFCAKMKELTGKPIRLPTEAEWEYACRAGTTSEFYSGDGKAALEKVGWYNRNSDIQTRGEGKPPPKKAPTKIILQSYPGNSGNSSGQTHVVGEKKTPNSWGLHDMHGNVWEWCEDFFANLGGGDTKDPVNIKSGDARVLRGGSWDSNVEDCRAASRLGVRAATRGNLCGFRVCFRLD